MYSFRKSKKGFTLIELMVVVAIIGVLALLGLRLYTGQQLKAKNAIVRANCGTIQTLIQAELAENSVSEVWGFIQETYNIYPLAATTTYLFERSGIHNPLSGPQLHNIVTGAINAPVAPAHLTNDGDVYVYIDNTDPGLATFFSINGIAADASDKVYNNNLTARP